MKLKIESNLTFFLMILIVYVVPLTLFACLIYSSLTGGAP